ncbi:MAG: fatty acid desaturase [Proteobacteria bacterium]|nr:fatty acid desaturase [Pseudomonadota bacterium]
MTGNTAAYEIAREFASPSYPRAIFQFGNTLLLYVVSVGLMFALLPVSYGYVLAVSLFAVVAHVRLFMIGHDCAHQSYLPRTGWQNKALGNFVGVLTNTPLGYWGSQHLLHHQTVGNLDRRGYGDVDTLTTEEFEARPFWGRVWYRIGRNPYVLMFIFAPIYFVIMQRYPFEQKRAPAKIWRSIIGTNIGMVIYYGCLIWIFGLESVLLVFAPIVLLSSAIATWLFYVQHQFDEAYWERQENWTYEEATLQGSSFYNLPRWLHWVTGNIGYHHIHHLNPKIPNYKLAECYASVPRLQNGKSISFWESFRLAKLALWDEANRRLVSFAEFDRSR